MDTHTYTHTYIHTHRTTTVALAAHARRGLIIIINAEVVKSSLLQGVVDPRLQYGEPAQHNCGFSKAAGDHEQREWPTLQPGYVTYSSPDQSLRVCLSF